MNIERSSSSQNNLNISIGKGKAKIKIKRVEAPFHLFSSALLWHSHSFEDKINNFNKIRFQQIPRGAQRACNDTRNALGSENAADDANATRFLSHRVSNVCATGLW